MFRRNAPQTIEHKGVDPVTGEPFLRRYWWAMDLDDLSRLIKREWAIECGR